MTAEQRAALEAWLAGASDEVREWIFSSEGLDWLATSTAAAFAIRKELREFIEKASAELEQFLSDFPLEQSSVLPPAPPETPLIAKGPAEITLTPEQLAWLKERGK